MRRRHTPAGRDRRAWDGSYRLRERWKGQPGNWLGLASAAFGAISDLRNLLYDTGVATAHRVPLPVVSIGGLTAGGSGKTPIVADLARRLCASGVDARVVAYGHPDEMAVLRTLCPGAQVYGGRDRVALARQAAVEGADMVLLDSGFQHRRLCRDLEIVVFDEVAARLPPRRLPAGPFRERPQALRRADLVVHVVRAEIGPIVDPAAGFPWPGVVWPPAISRARILPGSLVPFNDPASRAASPEPTVALAGVMWPEPFFATIRSRVPSVRTEIPLADHAPVSERLARHLSELAGAQGVVCTLKDASKLRVRLGDRVPIWYLSEHVSWEPDDAMPAALVACRTLLSGGAPAGPRGGHVGCVCPGKS